MSKKKRIILISVLVCLLAAFTGFAATRYSRYSTYVPFSRRIFDVDAEQLKSIVVQNGSTGYWAEVTDPEDVKALAAQLNQARYLAWIPDIFPYRSGWSYRIVLRYQDGQSVTCPFSETNIEVRGVHYFGSPGWLDGLCRMAPPIPAEE